MVLYSGERHCCQYYQEDSQPGDEKVAGPAMANKSETLNVAQACSRNRRRAAFQADRTIHPKQSYPEFEYAGSTLSGPFAPRAFLPVLNKSQASQLQEVYHSSHPDAIDRSLKYLLSNRCELSLRHRWAMHTLHLVQRLATPFTWCRETGHALHLVQRVSCNLAVFHYETTQNSVNCFHLHCPTLESCARSQRRNTILYNITKGIDPDLLVFGKYPTSSLRLWTNLSSSRFNSSDSFSSDKRQFHRLPSSSNPAQTSPSSIHESLLPSTSWEPSSSSNTASTPVPTITIWASSSTTVFYYPYHCQPFSGNPPTVHHSLYNNQPFSNIAAILSHFDSSKQYPNETKVYVSRNNTSEGEPSTLSPFWEVATDTLLVPVVICCAVLLVCCCTVLFSAGRRSRKRGRYKPVWNADEKLTCHDQSLFWQLS
ncbi:UNVERIFIED_CONTAM: hypothetical protein FKN15_036868 [Acipenser sinensis]